AFLAAMTVLGLRMLSHQPRGHNTVLANVAIEPRGTTVWRAMPSTDKQAYVLESGTLHLGVVRPPGAMGIVMKVPDGEIEDIGTEFSVTVVPTRTSSIQVESGAVVFRRSDGLVVHVGAGESWESSPRALLDTPVSTPPPDKRLEHPDVLKQASSVEGA